MKIWIVLIVIGLWNVGYSGARMQIGTPASVIESVLSSDTRETRTSMPSVSGQQIEIDITDYNYNGGYMSLTGKAVQSSSSIFMLKGTGDDLYGWVVMKDQDLAYEYTTDESGVVVAEEVPVTKIIPICKVQEGYHDPHFHPGPSEFLAPIGSSADIPHVGEYPGVDVTKLESRPESDKVIYMDITRLFNGSEPTYLNKVDWWQTWQGLASGLSMFDVNVTTNADVYNATPRENTAIARFLDQDGRSHAPINSFGTSNYSTMYKENNGYGYGRTLLHEVGHQLGMSHDGGGGDGEYFEGYSQWRWIPIMGNYWPGNNWNQALYQWSLGEYSGASQGQNDLNIINRNLDYLPDDIPESIPLVYEDGSTTVNTQDNIGQIARNTDSDQFSFQIGSGGGNATLQIDRIEYIAGAMLDVHAEIQNASGQVMQESNIEAARNAEIDVDLDAGIYYLVIRGGEEGTPSNGFSNYSSLGYYAIEGEITGGINNQINIALTLSSDVTFCAGEALTINSFFDATYTYQWYRNGTALTGETSNSLTVLDNASYYVNVSDGENNVNSKTVVTEVINLPPQPVVNVSSCNAGAGQVTLGAQNPVGTVSWYNTSTGITPLSIGDEFTVDLSAGNRYYVAQNNQAPAVFTGPLNNNVGDGGYHAGDYYQVFDAEKDLLIKSALVYADGAKTRRFVLYSPGGGVLIEKDIMVPDGQSRVDLNFEVPQGFGYQIGIDKINGADVDMYRNSNGASYPYTVEGLLSISQSTAGNGALEYFYYLYNWEVQDMEGSSCPSIRTQVVLDGCTDVRDGLSSEIVRIGLNPQQQLVLELSGLEVQSISLYNTAGKKVFTHGGILPVIDVSGFSRGNYLLAIETPEKTLVRKIPLF